MNYRLYLMTTRPSNPPSTSRHNNRRPEYLAAWWNVVNWDEINHRYEAFKAGKSVEDLAMAR